VIKNSVSFFFGYFQLLSLLNVSVEKLKIAKEERDRILDHLKPEEFLKKLK